MEAELELEVDRRRQNRRRERRYRCFKTARIVFNAGFTVFDCTVRNLSQGGALLEMETLLGIPKRFDISMEYGETPRPCEVRWRTDRRMGIQFADLPQAA